MLPTTLSLEAMDMVFAQQERRGSSQEPQNADAGSFVDADYQDLHVVSPGKSRRG